MRCGTHKSKRRFTGGKKGDVLMSALSWTAVASGVSQTRGHIMRLGRVTNALGLRLCTCGRCVLCVCAV